MDKKHLYAYLAGGLGVAVVFYFFLLGGFRADTISTVATDPFNQQQNINAAGFLSQEDTNSVSMQKMNTLVIQEVKAGTGAEATPGAKVTVHYVGKFQDGTVFDQSIGRGPFEFVLGAGQVIQGWDDGVKGMKVGGERILIVPPTLGYGSQNYGPIPGNSTLIFNVQLLGVSTTTGN